MDATLAEVLRLYGPLGAILVLLVLWVYRRLGSGRIVVASQSGEELQKRADAAESEAKRLQGCLAHQRDEADSAKAKLIAYLESSQRLQLAEVERLVPKEDK